MRDIVMGEKEKIQFDSIGYWSELKLEIVKNYAQAFTTILKAQQGFKRIYIDAFSGAGVHRSKTTGEFISGSPLNALNVEPRFMEYHFIDLDKNKLSFLQSLAPSSDNVHFYNEDCNATLCEKIFPRVRYADYKRALCLLDPYGLHLNWEVIEMAGQMGTIDIILNFPTADMKRNVFWRNPEKVADGDIARMNAFWGDGSWRDAGYTQQPGLFDIITEKNDEDAVVDAFVERLKEKGGFKYAAKSIPLRNTKNSIVFYLIIASQKEVAINIGKYLFKKYGHYTEESWRSIHQLNGPRQPGIP